MHKSNAANTYPIFFLFIEKDGTDSNSKMCRINYIITNTEIQPCSGTTREFLVDIFDRKDVTSTGAFSNYLFDQTQGYSHQKYSSDTLELDDIDDKFLEMILLSPMKVNQMPLDALFLSHKEINFFNDHADKNGTPALPKVSPQYVYSRLVVNDLPGYFLGDLDGQNDLGEKNYQKTLKWVSGNKGINVLLYIARPSGLSENLVYKIKIGTKGFKNNVQHLNSYLKELDYAIKIQKVGQNIQFSILRSDTPTTSETVDLPDNNPDQFIYLCFTFGGGMLFYNSASSGRAKYYETLTVFRVGEAYKRIFSSFEEDTEVNSLQPNHFQSADHKLVTVGIESPGASLQENFGEIRVYGVYSTEGVFPALFFNNFYEDHKKKNLPRCFFSDLSYKCPAYAMLANRAESFAPYSQTLNFGVVFTTIRGDLGPECKFYADSNCVIPRRDMIGSLDHETVSPLLGRPIKGANYDNLPQTDKDFYHLHTSDTGTKYLITCPISCKYSFYPKEDSDCYQFM